MEINSNHKTCELINNTLLLFESYATIKQDVYRLRTWSLVYQQHNVFLHYVIMFLIKRFQGHSMISKASLGLVVLSTRPQVGLAYFSFLVSHFVALSLTLELTEHSCVVQLDACSITLSFHFLVLLVWWILPGFNKSLNVFFFLYYYVIHIFLLIDWLKVCHVITNKLTILQKVHHSHE